MSFVRKLFGDHSGATSIEYGLIAALIAVIAISSFDTVGTNLAMVMYNVAFAECQATEVLCVMAPP